MVAYGFTDILMEWWESADMDVNIENSDHDALLSSARSLEVIKLLVKRGAAINTQDDSSETVLIRAIWDEDLETVRFLLQTGRVDVNVDAETAYYSCVLDTATRYSLEILKDLIEHAGADVNRPFKSYYAGSALAQVAAFVDLEAVEYLVNEANADVGLRLQHDRFGNALVAPVYAGNLDVIKFFVNWNKVDVNEPVEYEDAGTALQVASLEGHEQVVQLLLENNAEVNAQGGMFGTAL
jgi:ankyrin repeat protein